MVNGLRDAKKISDTRALRRPIQVENPSIRPLTSLNSILVVPEQSCHAQVTEAGRDSSCELRRNKNMAPFENQRLSNVLLDVRGCDSFCSQ